MNGKLKRNPRVLVTRPKHSNQGLCDCLEQNGFEALTLPCLDILPIELDASNRQKIHDLDRYDWVIVVSKNAAEIGVGHFEDFWPQWPIRQWWMGIGAVTHDWLRARHLPVTGHVPPGSSEQLMEVLSQIDWRDQRVLIVRGEGGREWLADTLTVAGARVDYFECYRRGCAAGLMVAVRELGPMPPFEAVTVSSGESLECLSKACREYSGWLDVPVVVPSERVAAEADRLGWKHIVVADGAYDANMVAALRMMSDT